MPSELPSGHTSIGQWSSGLELLADGSQLNVDWLYTLRVCTQATPENVVPCINKNLSPNFHTSCVETYEINCDENLSIIQK